MYPLQRSLKKITCKFIFVLKRLGYGLGLATELRSEKIPRNRLGMDSVVPRKKMLIPRAFRGPRKSLFRSSERNGIKQKKLVLHNSQSHLKNDLSVAQSIIFLNI